MGALIVIAVLAVGCLVYLRGVRKTGGGATAREWDDWAEDEWRAVRSRFSGRRSRDDDYNDEGDDWS